MNKDDLLSSAFLNQFKNGEELNSFLHELQKRGVEQLLEGELDAHLGYENTIHLTMKICVMAIL